MADKNSKSEHVPSQIVQVRFELPMKASLSDHKQQGIAVIKGEQQRMASHCPGLCTVSHEREKKLCQGHQCFKAVQRFPQAHELESKHLTHTVHSNITWVSYFVTSSDHKMMPSKALQGACVWEKSGAGGERRKKMQAGKRHLAARGMLCLWLPDFLCLWSPCPLPKDSKQHYYRDR